MSECSRNLIDMSLGSICFDFSASWEGYRKYKPPFCSSSEVSYLKFPHSFTAQAPILTAGPA